MSFLEVDKFVYLFKKEEHNIIYFSPEKMKTLYLQAFVPEAAFCAPLPPHLPEDDNALTYEEASKAGYFRKKNLTGLEG
jgi:hypothetical protein